MVYFFDFLIFWLFPFLRCVLDFTCSLTLSPFSKKKYYNSMKIFYPGFLKYICLVVVALLCLSITFTLTLQTSQRVFVFYTHSWDRRCTSFFVVAVNFCRFHILVFGLYYLNGFWTISVFKILLF